MRKSTRVLRVHTEVEEDRVVEGEGRMEFESGKKKSKRWEESMERMQGECKENTKRARGQRGYGDKESTGTKRVRGQGTGRIRRTGTRVSKQKNSRARNVSCRTTDSLKRHSLEKYRSIDVRYK